MMRILIAGLIILASLAIRFYLILNSDPAGDEIWALQLISNSFTDIWRGALADTNAPLYFLLLHGLQIISGIHINLILYRFISLFFSILAIVGIGYLGVFLFNKRVGVVSVILSLFLPASIWISVFGRFYALLELTTVLILFSFIQFIRKKDSKYLNLFVGVSIVGLYIHFYYIFLIISFCIYLLINKENRVIMGRWAYALIAISAIYLPVVFSFITIPRWDVINLSSDLIKIPAVYLSYITSLQTIIFLQHKPVYLSFVILLVVLILLFMLLYYGLRSMPSTISRLFLLVFLVPIGIESIVSYMIRPILAVNSFLLFLPVFILVLANGLVFAWNKRKAIVLSFSILVVIIFIPFFQSFSLSTEFAEPFRYVKRELKKEDITLHSDIYTFIGARYYLEDSRHYAVTSSVTNEIAEKTHGYYPIPLAKIKSFKGMIWYFEPHFYNVNNARDAKSYLDRTLTLVRQQKFEDSLINIYLYKTNIP